MRFRTNIFVYSETREGLVWRFLFLHEKMLQKQMLGCCKVYISESRNKAALGAIERATKNYPNCPIVNKFEDDVYNRVGYTLVSEMGPDPISCSFKSCVFETVRVAFQEIDLQMHSGAHPRLGVVDHICFHSMDGISLDRVAATAKSLAADVGSKLRVATFLYGASHHEGRSLDSIRRELGYFKPNSAGNQWTGGPKSEHLSLTPDEGPSQALERKGVVVIGATQWVDNYNIPIFSDDMTKIHRISRRVSGRGGGLESVQSMALVHGDGIVEVACNLLDPSKIGGDYVQLQVERLAKEDGLEVGKGYYTDLSRDRLIERYLELIRTAEDAYVKVD